MAADRSSPRPEPTFEKDDSERSTEAMEAPFGVATGPVDEFDPDDFEVAATVSQAMPYVPEFDEEEEEEGANDLPTGTELGGRYRIESVLGRGACGVVYEASHLIIGKRVALKCLDPSLRKHSVQVERFFKEARIAATVEHPNVVKIFDGGDDKGTLFLAMELLEGETLGERLDRGPMPVDETIDLFLKLLDAVAAVHDKGVIHRDLKPDNVFLPERRGELDAEPKVLDFGISKLKEPGRRELTRLGTVMGTPFYMAPEQAMDSKAVDARVDVYSLGVMMYEAVSGQLPYEGDTPLEIFEAARRADWTPLDRLSRDVPKILAKVVAKAMNASPEKRFASVRDMHRALAAVRAAESFDVGTAHRTIEDFRSPLAGLSISDTLDEDEDLGKLAQPPAEDHEHRATGAAGRAHDARPPARTERPAHVGAALAGGDGVPHHRRDRARALRAAALAGKGEGEASTPSGREAC